MDGKLAAAGFDPSDLDGSPLTGQRLRARDRAGPSKHSISAPTNSVSRLALVDRTGRLSPSARFGESRFRDVIRRATPPNN